MSISLIIFKILLPDMKMYNTYFNTKNVPYVIKLKSSIDSETLAKCFIHFMQDFTK